MQSLVGPPRVGSNLTSKCFSQYGQGAVKQVCSVRDAEMEEREGPILRDIVGSGIAQYARFGYRAYQVLRFWFLSTIQPRHRKIKETKTEIVLV
jgi:hypothetical protein